MRGRAKRIAIALCALLLVASASMAKNHAFKSTAHGDPARGPQRRTDRPRGSCTQCHGSHASHERGASGRNDAGLFAPTGNELCFECHATLSANGIFPGVAEWQRSVHANDSRVLRPDNPRLEQNDTNGCVNCHDPHGNADSRGVIPSMLDVRGEELCLTCHDGSRAADLRSELTKTYVHPLDTRGRHAAGEGGDEARFRTATPADRHVTCADCHNPHRIGSDPAPPSAPLGSNRLAGVSRVEVVNGGAGAQPSYRWHAAGEIGEQREYEVCFKCHSSFVRQPARQPDLARLTNPANPSFHPIQAEGKNRGIDSAAFVNGYAADSLLLCTSCHGTDDLRLRGPHASSNAFLLRKPATTSDDGRAMQRDDLCFDCHAWDVYADAAAAELTQRASRFNSPAGAGHAFHVGMQRVPCYSCHESHGSARYPALIESRPGGKFVSYVQTPSGGTCTTGCHNTRTYTVNYPR